MYKISIKANAATRKVYLRFGCPSIMAYPVGSFPAPSRLREKKKESDYDS